MASLFTPPAGDNPDSTLPPLPETPPSEPTTSHTSDVHQGTITKKPAIERVRANENQAITRTQDRLDEKNWAVWRLRLTLMLEICGVQGYVEGKIPRPDPAQDPDGATNWDFNDICKGPNCEQCHNHTNDVHKTNTNFTRKLV